ncbi:MAG: GNAT family N-acetyltransferase [Deltaproteobacteria bacterium]|nr:GNAT family N-acetyltransferase [Deltaproteobacteria bacterium]
MKTEAVIEMLPWDSEHFGCRIARVVPKRLTHSISQEITDQAEKEGVDCLYLLADASDRETIRWAERMRFRLVDIRLNLEAETGAAPPTTRSLAADIPIRLAVQEDLPGLQELSQNAFRDSRFYRDPQFPDALCDRLYERWIENLLTSPSAFVFVSGAPGQPQGYTACRLRDGIGEIDLLSVAPDAKTRGLGRALLEAALRRFAESGADRILSVTQGQNLKAQRVAMRAGIFPVDVQVWYHRWRCDSEAEGMLSPIASSGARSYVNS